MDEKASRRRLRLLAEAEDSAARHVRARSGLARQDPDVEGAVFEVNFRRGDVLRHLELHHEALVALHRAFDEKPDDIDLLMAMAWCCKRESTPPPHHVNGTGLPDRSRRADHSLQSVVLLVAGRKQDTSFVVARPERQEG